MTWIKTIPFDKADGKLKTLYKRLAGPGNNVDNILQVHSLRPHTLEGHMKLYKNVLHHNDNALPKWLLETIGVYVSMLNECKYCVDHHSAGLKRLIDNETRYTEVINALKTNRLESAFDERESALLRYAEALTLHPKAINRSFVQEMVNIGWDHGHILETNQVTAYFNYANRTVQGLGVNTDGDILGLSPNSGEEDNWSHQ